MLEIHWWSLITMIFIVIGSVHSQTCNSTAIVTDLNACTQQFGDPAQPQYLQTVCENVECYLQCISDAVGNCYTNVEFSSYNISRLKVTNRALCSNLTYFYDGIFNNYCSLYNYTCWEEQNFTGLASELATINATTNLTQYKDAFCQLNTALLTCLDIQPNNDNCTTAMIDFLKDYFNTLHSYEECGLSETHQYFTTYSGALNCTATNSSNQTTPSNTTVDPSSTTAESTSQYSSTSAPSSSTMESSSQSSTMSSSTSSTMESSSQSSAMSSSTSSTMESSSQSSAMPSSTSSTMESSTQSSVMSSSTASTMESSSQSSTMSDSTSSSTQSTTQRPNQECSWQQVLSNLGSCYNISADQFSSSFEDTLASFCENVECHIQCYTDAVGDCYLEDQAFFFDPVVYKVVMRAYCNNITATINAFTLCVMDDTTCIQTYLSALSSIHTSAQTSNDYATFANDYCSASSTYDSCVTFTPDDNCTSSYASLMKHIQTVSVSYERCSQQNHGYFFTYGSEVACGGCSITPHFLLLCVAILSFLQFNN